MKLCVLNMNNFDVKKESLFIALSGFAKSCVDVSDDITLPISRMANYINKYFEKQNIKYAHNKVYSFLERQEIGKYTMSFINEELEKLQSLNDGKTSPQILLVLAIDKLINEYNHFETRLKFCHFDVDKMIDEIYSIDRYKKFIKSHSDFIEKL